MHQRHINYLQEIKTTHSIDIQYYEANPMDQETDTNNIRVIIHELTTED